MFGDRRRRDSWSNRWRFTHRPRTLTRHRMANGDRLRDSWGDTEVGLDHGRLDDGRECLDRTRFHALIR
jgi:hypothetical protein